MDEKGLKDVIHAQNELIHRQLNRINLLEERFAEVRKKYLRLKVDTERQSNRVDQVRQLELMY